ncbi:MAG: phage head closure protein [Clostridiaceae bacterium]|nr:phage head closure protein [Clostridiaceae bacterium]
MMQSGDLRTPIRIQHEVTTGTGSFATVTWYDLDDTAHAGTAYNIYAKWVNVHGSEAWVADSVQAQLGATVTIRYRSDVTSTCRVLLGSTIYEIASPDNIKQRNEWLEIKVKASVMGQ